MIDKLNISNFMTFEKLEIPVLKKVNLIAGKNNSGKTSLLEAIRILRSDGDNAVVNDILDKRGALVRGRNSSYEALFNFKNIEQLNFFEINDFELKRRKKTDKTNDYFYRSDTGGNLDSNLNNAPYESLVYVPYQSGDKKLHELWGNIVLTPKEDDVHQILRDTVEPRLIRFDVSGNVRVRLNNNKQPVPLGTLGDGVYRILLIALSLANAQNSILLIDEIELGLHYSAMEKLWEMIFKYAKKWNIQVFATTHSQDAIRTFHYVASDEKYINDAEYIRLQISRNGENEAIIFDGDRLKDSLNLHLEIR